MKGLMRKINFKNSGVSIIQALIAGSLLSGLGLAIMQYTQQQGVTTKKMTADIAMNYVYHNITKSLTVSHICTHSMGGNGASMSDKDISKIELPLPDGKYHTIVEAIGREGDGKGGKFNVWVSSMKLRNIRDAETDNPASGLLDGPFGGSAEGENGGFGGIKVGDLRVEFTRTGDKNNEYHVSSTVLPVAFILNGNGTMKSCLADEEYNAMAFCTMSLRGNFDMGSKKCTNINITSATGAPSAALTALNNSSDESLPGDIVVNGKAQFGSWDGAQGIIIDKGVITNAESIVAVGSINANKIRATRFNHTSDKRLKKNIHPITSKDIQALDKVSGVEFNWKKDGSPGVGFIAQDIQKVYPHLVSKHPTTGVLTVDYAGLLPIVLETVKIQNEKIEDLSARLQKLKKK